MDFSDTKEEAVFRTEVKKLDWERGTNLLIQKLIRQWLRFDQNR